MDYRHLCQVRLLLTGSWQRATVQLTADAGQRPGEEGRRQEKEPAADVRPACLQLAKGAERENKGKSEQQGKDFSCELS